MSGFVSRKQEQVYNTVLAKLISLLCERLSPVLSACEIREGKNGTSRMSRWWRKPTCHGQAMGQEDMEGLYAADALREAQDPPALLQRESARLRASAQVSLQCRSVVALIEIVLDDRVYERWPDDVNQESELIRSVRRCGIELHCGRGRRRIREPWKPDLQQSLAGGFLAHHCPKQVTEVSWRQID